MELLNARRDASPISPEKLSRVIYGGEREMKRLQRIWNIMENEFSKEFSREMRPFDSPYSRYVNACRKIMVLTSILKRENITTLDEMYDYYLCVDENLPIDVHLSMFIPTLMYQTTDEQKELWLNAALQFKIIGTYAQTELGHGSNVRGIETTATFDPETDEFIIHTPSLTAMKWWPGGLALTCTHACVVANLIIQEKCYGAHCFFVQLRSLTDHSLLPNIETGVIGPKLGFSSMDNGYARFTHLRIPRNQMLMRWASVDAKGHYSKHPDAEKKTFGTMLDVRARICRHCGYVLARCLTIAIRYSIVRQQGGGGGSNSVEEKSVIDYRTQQALLYPYLAFAYAFHFTGASLTRSYRKYLQSEVLSSSSTSSRNLPPSLLADLHATSSCLKLYMCEIVSYGGELCRRACGGHGFLLNAGFGELLGSFLPMNTLEGTKEILGIQAGRYMVLKYIKARHSPLKGSTDVDTSLKSFRFLDFITPEVFYRSFDPQILAANRRSLDSQFFQQDEIAPKYLLGLFQSRSVGVVSRVADRWMELMKKRQAEHVKNPRNSESNGQSIWDELGIDLIRCAEATADYLVLRCFLEGIEQSSLLLDVATKSALLNLYYLLCVHLLMKHLGDFMMFGLIESYPCSHYLPLIHSSLLSSLNTLDLSLIEAWNLSDVRLNSTLGSKQGNVYEALLEATINDPLNQKSVSEGYEKYLHRVIDSNFQSSLRPSTSRL